MEITCTYDVDFEAIARNHRTRMARVRRIETIADRLAAVRVARTARLLTAGAVERAEAGSLFSGAAHLAGAL